MTAAEISDQLKPLGSDSYKRILFNHGVKGPVWGVKIEELKKVQKRVKKDHRLALDLFDTGVYDLRYLAGLIADETKVSKKELKHWLATAGCAPLCGSVVSWLAAESAHGWELALEWIDSKKEMTAQTGWTTLSSLVAVKDDAELDLGAVKKLLERVARTIHHEPDDVRYAMNGFVIAAGIYVKDLSDLAVKTAEKVGKVTVDMGDTACKVPYAPEYIAKAKKRGSLGKKLATARC